LDRVSAPEITSKTRVAAGRRLRCFPAGEARRIVRWVKCTIAIAVLAACGTHSTTNAPTSAPEARADHGFQKGQLHLHSSNSGDSRTPPSEVARWYREHGFDFIVFTDHNVVTTLDVAAGSMLAIPGIELTQNLRTCDPAPVAGEGCLLHVNALFVTPSAHPLDWTPPTDPHRLALYLGALDEATSLGGVAQLNHPNFHWAADAGLITELVKHGLTLFEVANQSSDVANAGDANHPSTEALWDAVLTAGGHLYGVATDDAHQYDDAEAVRARGIVPDVGDKGWVMVHAAHDAAAIREALARGDFYASTGVTLARVAREGEAVVIEVADESPGEHEIVCIANGGREVARSHGRSARCPLAAGGYVRATVSDGHGHQAWVQPTWHE
jgi:hypothetical protein